MDNAEATILLVLVFLAGLGASPFVYAAWRRLRYGKGQHRG